MTNLITQQSMPTMSSHEIAELVGARHNDVVATIERLFEKGLLRSSRKSRSVATGGRPLMVYDLSKRDTLVIASGYNDEMRARIIDRWQELEEHAAAPMLMQPSPINDILLVSAAVSRVPGVNPGIAMSLALDVIETHTGLPVTVMRKALPGISAANAIKMNAGELAARFSLTARSINPILADLGLQAKDGKDWILTEAGIKYGEMIPYTNRGHSGYQALWHESVFDALRERLGPPDAKQAA